MAHLPEDLRKWFGTGKTGGVGGGGWDRYNTKGERIGKCGDAEDRGGEGEGKPKCLSRQKANQLRAQGGKQAIANAVKRKKAQDPVTNRKGTGNPPRPISNRIAEENVPSNPSLWSRAKSLAKSKFDVYPSAYANGWAAKWYKEHGGTWSTKEDTSADREWGTDSLVQIYKRDTPGQQDEAADPSDEITQTARPASYKPDATSQWTADMLTREHIVKVGDKYRLISKKTGKNLGTYNTKAGAEKRERQVQYFKHHEDTMSQIPSFKTFIREDETAERITLDSTSDGVVTEVTPPGMEAWVKANKRRFKKEYGDAEGERILYATAWDMYHKGKSEAANDVRMTDEDVSSIPLRTAEDADGDDDTSMAHAQLASIADRAHALRSALATAGELPAWVQAKITDAETGILSVHDYLMYKN